MKLTVKALGCVMVVWFLFLSTISVHAQELLRSTLIDGGISIYQDSRIDALLQEHVTANKKEPYIEGYRVMLFFDSGNNSKDNAYKIMVDFSELYPDIPVYITFNPPYYRVRGGDFRTKLDAERFLMRIRYKYSNAYVIKTTINFPLL